MFAAASLKNALDDVIAAYGTETGTKVTASYAASSALAKQIEQGAPAQLFISADLDWMDYLQERHLIAEGTRKNLLGNSLVLVAGKDSKLGEVAIGPGFDLAALLGDGRLAVGEVKAVPAGSTPRRRSSIWAPGAASRASSPRPRTCARRWRWSRAARRRSGSSTRPTPHPTPPSRSSAPFRPTATRRSSTRRP